MVQVNRTKGVNPASFADSSQLQIGDIALAIGNPLGLASSVTEGIVSFNGRTVGEGNGRPWISAGQPASTPRPSPLA